MYRNRLDLGRKLRILNKFPYYLKEIDFTKGNIAVVYYLYSQMIDRFLLPSNRISIGFSRDRLVVYRLYH